MPRAERHNDIACSDLEKARRSNKEVNAFLTVSSRRLRRSEQVIRGFPRLPSLRVSGAKPRRVTQRRPCTLLRREVFRRRRPKSPPLAVSVSSPSTHYGAKSTDTQNRFAAETERAVFERHRSYLPRARESARIRVYVCAFVCSGAWCLR